MQDEPAESRRGRGGALADLAREDLELYGVAELEDRIGFLQTEIGRTNAQLERKISGKAAADALFRFGKT